MVRVTTEPLNTAPVANAGADAQVFLGDTVELDGSASSDVDGDTLSFGWEFIATPDGSTALLSDPSAVQPTFVPDLFGNYRLRLTVSDGRGGSHSDEVLVTTELRNRPPVANAGLDQTAEFGETVLLDGGASADADGDALIYMWSLIARPPGSSTALINPNAQVTAFAADRPGDFVIQLIVNDGRLDSAPDTVIVTTSNTRPVADAGPAQTVVVGAAVQLDGSGSSDANGDALSFSWSFTARPAGSTGDFSDPTAESPTFVADQPGLFVVQLIVSDAALDSAPDTTTITVEVLPDEPEENPPSIGNLVVPAVIALDGEVTVSFDYDDPDGDIAAIEILQEDAPELDVTLPAPLAGITGLSGRAALTLRGEDLRFGEPTTIWLRLRDQLGAVSGALSFTITAAGAGGGTPPAITNFAVSSATWTRPVGPYDSVRPGLSFDWADPEGDVARLRITLVGPPGVPQTGEIPAARFGIDGTVGRVALRLLNFSAGSTLGAYRISLAPIDRAGNVGPTESVVLELVATGGEPALTITGFAPPLGAAGTDVLVTGAGFDASAPGRNRVELGGVPVEVVAATPTALTVVVPEGAPPSAPFVLNNALGTTASTAFFSVPANLSLTPTEPEVPVGRALSFAPRVTSAVDPSITWLVDGVVGGTAAAGTITADGRYTAPAGVPPSGVATVEARLTAEPGVSAAANVRIVPPNVYPGLALVLATAGGQVSSADGSAAIAIPPYALDADTPIDVQALRGADLPAPPPGFRVVGGARFEPSGLVFTSAATVAISLDRYQPPGTQLPFRYLLPDGTFSDEGITATVADNGEQAVAEVRHFSTGILLGAVAPEAEVAGPVVTALTPNIGQEGRRVPVLVTGSALDSLLTVEALAQDGSPTDDLAVGPLYPLGDRLGFLVTINPIATLPEGANREYVLRFRRTASAPVDQLFTVTGLDELIVDQQTTQTLRSPAPRRYSEIRVAGTVMLAEGDLELESTGPVRVVGRIVATGDDGAPLLGAPLSWLCGGGTPGAEAQCGQAGPRDGRGGLGRERTTLGETTTSTINDLLAFGPLGIVGSVLGAGLNLVLDDSEDPEHRGGHGLGCESPDAAHTAEGCTFFFRSTPKGVGGVPGNDLDLEEIRREAIPVVSGIAGCIGALLPPGPVTGVVCAAAAQEAVSFVEGVVDRTQMLTGRRGFGAGPNGLRGGGGGGGGRFRTIDFSPADFGFVSTVGNFAVAIDGGGGGQGGGTGRNVSIISSADILLLDSAAGGADLEFVRRIFGNALLNLPDQGKVRANGGRGGNGSPDGRLTVVTNHPLAKAILDLVPWPTVPALEGGGGGGGAGGDVLLAAGLGVSGSGALDEHVFVNGGPGGGGGEILLDPDTGARRPNSQNPNVLANGANGTRRVNPSNSGLVFQRVSADGTTAFATSVTNRSVVQVQFRGPASGSITVPVVADDGRRAEFESVWNPAIQRHVATLAFFEGFNTVGIGHELLRVRVLSLFVDSDRDGLSDADETFYRTDPNNPDTDGDGASDLTEILDGSNPLLADADRDGLPDGLEASLGTSPVNADTDGDGVRDGAEALLGGDPLDPTNRPAEVPAGTLLAATQFGFLSVVDVASGRTGGLGRPAGGLGFGIAYDDEGRLFAASFSRLLVVDPLVADAAGDLTVTDVGSFGEPDGIPVRVTQIAYDTVTDTLYGVELGSGPDFLETGQLVSISPTTGAATRVGVPGPGPLHALAFDATGRLLATTALDATTDLLVELDPLSGAVVNEIGALGRPFVFGLAFDSRGVLWGTAVRSVREGDLLRVNATTGASTVLAPVDRSLFGITFATCRAPCAGAETGYRVGLRPAAIAAADVDGDGDIDLLTANRTSVSLLRNAGDGTFLPATTIPIGDYFGLNLAMGDLNGDGRADMVVGIGGLTASVGVVVRLGNGDGTFQAAGVTLTTTATGLPGGVAIADMDRDGNPDVVVATQAGTSFVDVLRGNGAGGLTALSRTVLPSLPNSLAVADFNGDGAFDAAVGEFGPVLYLLRGDGGGGLTLQGTVAAVGNSNGSVRSADLNRDGNADLLWANNFSNAIESALGNGNGTFQAARAFPAGGSYPWVVAVGDVTNDGVPDAISGNAVSSTVAVLTGNGLGGFAVAAAFPVPGIPSDIVVADLDGNGTGDIATVTWVDTITPGIVTVQLLGAP
jgi:hypothetical protein